MMTHADRVAMEIHHVYFPLIEVSDGAAICATRAAIAVIRDLTPKMIEAGEDAFNDQLANDTVKNIVAKVFQAMIDELFK